MIIRLVPLALVVFALSSPLVGSADNTIPAATHPLEVEFWAAFKRAAVPGLSVAQVQPFARALAAGPEKSKRLSYLIEAMLVAQRPAESPYFGRDAQQHVEPLVSALRALERPAPKKEAVITALHAMDVFTRTHTATLNLNRASLEVIPTPYTAMQVAQHLHGGGESAEFSARWAAPVADTLERFGVDASNKRLNATAAGLYLYAHWLTAPVNTPLAPARYTDSSWEGTLTALQYARYFAALSAWHYFWQPLDPGAPETAAVIELFNRDPVLGRSNLISVLGFTPGDATLFGAKYRKEAGFPKATYYVVAGNPPSWGFADQPTAPAVWPAVEAPEIRQVRKKIEQSREALHTEVARYQESRRIYSLDDAHEQLEAFDGTSPGAGRKTGAESAQRGLDEARADYQKDLRDGVYVGRSQERADTVITRDLTSTERRAREFELERLERSLADEQREVQRQQDQARARSRERDQLANVVREREQLVDSPGHQAKVEALKESIKYYENRHAELLKQQHTRSGGSGLNTTRLIRARFIRETIRDAMLEKYNALEKKAATSKSAEDELERLWFWWLFDTPEMRDPDADSETFYGIKEEEEAAKEEKADRELRGKPLAEFAEVLLERLSPKGPTHQVSGWSAAFEPRFPPSMAWRLNQVAGILDDTWFRFAHEPYTMRAHVFRVVKALRAATADDALTVDSLRPWIKRFRAHAPSDLQEVVFKWDAEPQISLLLSKAMM